jgi:hypothetical protein
MNRKPLPYPPQMRNGGLPPAHFPSSPHSNPVAAIANLKAIVSNAIAASAKKGIARCHEANVREKALADEANERHCHKAARALQEAAAACACQEVAAARAHCRQLFDKQAARARQEAAAARDRQEEASQVISLWLRCQCLFARLAREANERHCHESAKCDTTSASTALAEDKYDDVAGQLEAYATTLFACVDAIMAKIQAMDDGFGNWVAAREKALTNKADELCQAAAWEKVLADEADKLCQAAAREKALADKADKLRQAAAREKALADKADELRQAAAWEKALADKANKQCRADTRKKALADEAYKQRRAAMRKKVLANEVNKRRRRPSTMVNGQPQTACCRS